MEPSTGAVSLRAVLPNPQRRLLPGMFVRVALEQGARQNVYVIPQDGRAARSRRDCTSSSSARMAKSSSEPADAGHRRKQLGRQRRAQARRSRDRFRAAARARRARP